MENDFLSVTDSTGNLLVDIGESYFNVCICDPYCDFNELRKACQGMNITLHVRNKKGEIIPVTEEMVKRAVNKKKK